MTAEYGSLGELVYSPAMTFDSDSNLRRRQVRQKLFEELPNARFKKAPIAKIVLSNPDDIEGELTEQKLEFGMTRFDPNWTRILCFTTSAAGTTAVTNTTRGATVGGARPTVYFLVASTDVRLFIVGEEHMLKNSDNLAAFNVDITARTTVTLSGGGGNPAGLDDGTYGMITATALTAEPEGGDTYGKVQHPAHDEATYSRNISLSMGELSQLPLGTARRPGLTYNVTQIFMSGHAYSGTKARSKNIFAETEVKLLERKSADSIPGQIDRAALFGTRVDDDSTVIADLDNAEGTRYRTGGLQWYLNKYYPQNIKLVPEIGVYGDTNFTGKDFVEAGVDFFEELSADLALTGSNNRLLVMSQRAALAVQRIFRDIPQITITPNFIGEWKFEVTRIQMSNCTFELLINQEWSMDPSMNYFGAILDPGNMHWIPMSGRDLTYIDNGDQLPKGTGVNGFVYRDGFKSGWQCEGMFTFDNLAGQALIDGFGMNFKAA